MLKKERKICYIYQRKKQISPKSMGGGGLFCREFRSLLPEYRKCKKRNYHQKLNAYVPSQIAEQFKTYGFRIWGTFEALIIWWFNDSWTRGFELTTRGFQLVIRGFVLVTRGFEFQLVLLRFQLVTRNSRFTISHEISFQKSVKYHSGNFAGQDEERNLYKTIVVFKILSLK